MKTTNPTLSAHHASIFLRGLESAKDFNTIQALQNRHGDYLLGADMPRLQDAYLDAVERVHKENDVCA